MTNFSRAVAASVLACAANLACAADFDGSKALICANVQAVECEPGSTACTRGTPAELGAPMFLRIDFAGKRIVGPKQITPIRTMEKSAGQLLLQGSELGFGWTLALDTANGQITSTLVDRDGVIAMFGACTLP